MQKYLSFGLISSICLREWSKEIVIVLWAMSKTFRDQFFVQMTSKINESPSEESKFEDNESSFNLVSNKSFPIDAADVSSIPFPLKFSVFILGFPQRASHMSLVPLDPKKF